MCFVFFHAYQVIQIFSAKDQDLPSAGQQFSFRTSKEDVKNKNFTVRDFGSKYVNMKKNKWCKKFF